MRSFVLQLVALLLVAVVGSALYWRTGTPTPAANSLATARPSPPAAHANVAAISFKNVVEPIFRAHCAECHLDGASSGGLHLDSYQGLMQGGTILAGPIVTAGDHAHSFLWQIIKPGGNWPGGNRMPFSGPPYLSSGQIQIIADWIDQGARNN